MLNNPRVLSINIHQKHLFGEKSETDKKRRPFEAPTIQQRVLSRFHLFLATFGKQGFLYQATYKAGCRIYMVDVAYHGLHLLKK